VSDSLFDAIPADRREAARVQALPPFPPLADYFAVIAGMLEFLRGSGLFATGLLGALPGRFRAHPRGLSLGPRGARRQPQRPQSPQDPLRRRAAVARGLGSGVP
jgi:hypothetical protein